MVAAFLTPNPIFVNLVRNISTSIEENLEMRVSECRCRSFRNLIACEQALLFGRVKRVSRERASERPSREGQRKGPSLARSREARFACQNRRACSQAKNLKNMEPLSIFLMGTVQSSAVHTKPVNQLTETPSFWNRSPRYLISFLIRRICQFV